MRNWCAGVVMGALLALPLCAQEKNAAAAGDTSGAATTAEKSAPASSPLAGSKVIVVKGIFALPATPRPMSFPGGQPPAKDARPPGLLVPRYEIAGLYHFVNFAPGDAFANFNNHGGTGSFTYNFSKWYKPAIS